MSLTLIGVVVMAAAVVVFSVFTVNLLATGPSGCGLVGWSLGTRFASVPEAGTPAGGSSAAC